MKRLIVVWMAYFALLSEIACAQSTSASLTARPIQVVSCANLPADIPFDIKPMGYQAGFEVFYLVEGHGLAAVKDHSLVISAIRTKEGIDISRTRGGRPAYEQGSFPKVSEDGKYALFSVKSEEEQFGKAESLIMQGSVVVLTGSKREENSITLPVTEKQPRPLGPFTVVPGKELGAQGMLMGESAFGVTVKGPLSSIIDIELVSNGVTNSSRSSFSSGSQQTFFFEKPSSPSVTIQMKYWTDLQEQTVTFGK